MGHDNVGCVYLAGHVDTCNAAILIVWLVNPNKRILRCRSVQQAGKQVSNISKRYISEVYIYIYKHIYTYTNRVQSLQDFVQLL